MVKVISPTEIEGVRNVGSFCYYKPEESYPIYFVAEFSHPANDLYMSMENDELGASEYYFQSLKNLCFTLF